MKIAMLNGRLVRAELCRRPADYHCADCGAKVILCRGKQKAAYFAHLRRPECGSSDGETP